MLSEEILATAQAPYPDAGTLRVHPDPAALAPAEPDRPGLNRFDDPDGRVSVRYTATRLVGCLRETLSRFRPNPAAEAALAQVDGLEAGDVDLPAEDLSALADWLDAQRVGVVQVRRSGFFVEIETPHLLTQLDKHPRVRDAVVALDPAARLDVGLIRLGGRRLGRPVSQAVGVAVREWIPDALGIGYRSRFATDEPCWAMWDTTPVDVSSEPLSPDDARHRQAIRAVAAEFELELPPNWQ